MGMKVKKRDGEIRRYDEFSIISAVNNAVKSVYLNKDNQNGIPLHLGYDIAANITHNLQKKDVEEIHVETIQDMVEEQLMECDKAVARAYILYRAERNKLRNSKTYRVFNDIINAEANEITKENANMNAETPAGMMMKFASETTKAYTDDCLISPETREAIDNNYIHVHDKDYYPTKSLTCLQHPLNRILENGFRAGHGASRPAKRIETASIIGCISMETVQNEMHGGQAIPAFDFYLAPYVRLTYIEEIKKLEEYDDADYSSYYDYEIKDYICDDRVTGDYPKSVKKAIFETQKRVHQAMEAFIHNMNTIHSRGGNQVVFSSINYGTDTSAEGRCIIRELLLSTYNGVGNGETPIFPIQIWKLKEGVSAVEGDGNYDLLKLACKVTAKRFFPNFLNLDASFNKHDKWSINDPKRYEYEVATMGCVDGNEVVTYKYNGRLFVESFRRMWNRLSDYFETKKQNKGDIRNLYLDVENVEIYDTKKGFVIVKRVIRNISYKWINVKLSNGRSLLCTNDHPFHTERGRVYADNLNIGDIINVNSRQYYEENSVFSDEKAWLLGFILCDGCYDSHVTSSIALEGEDDIQKAYIMRMKKCFDNDVKVIERHRGKKGDYKDLRCSGDVTHIIDDLSTKFEGLTKNRRHIPNEVFTWNYTAKLAFLAGMIDADGYINPTTHGGSVVQIGSVNKELALQQMALAQALGMPSKIYHNHYSQNNPVAIRYRVEFVPTEDLLTYIVSEKKINNVVKREVNDLFFKSEVVSAEPIERTAYSYDVETISDHFEVSGIYSHNCRTRVFENRHGEKTSIGRGNCSFTTINLVKIALECRNIEDFNVRIKKFYSEFDKYIDITVKQLKERYEFQKTALKSQFPMLMSGLWNGSEKLIKNDTVGDVLLQGTLGVGFIGLAECLIALTGKHHGESQESQKLGLEIISHLKRRVDSWADQLNLNYSVLATPAEGLSGKFTKKDRKTFGIIPNITDKDYYTNSNHIPVWYHCSIKHKAEVEAPYHALTLGGHILYVEFDGDATHNNEAVLQFTQIIRQNNAGYGSVNHLRNRCLDCGFENAQKALTACPRCGSSRIDTIQRITGYLVGTIDSWNDAKKSELNDRVCHD